MDDAPERDLSYFQYSIVEEGLQELDDLDASVDAKINSVKQEIENLKKGLSGEINEVDQKLVHQTRLLKYFIAPEPSQSIKEIPSKKR